MEQYIQAHGKMVIAKEKDHKSGTMAHSMKAIGEIIKQMEKDV